VRVAGFELGADEYTLLLQAKDGVACEPLPTSDAIVTLDLSLTPELVAEGQARDVVRAIQQARKEADLHVSDRVRVALELPAEWKSAVARFRDYVSAQTLASSLVCLDLIEFDRATSEGFFVSETTLPGGPVRIGVARDAR